MCMKYTRLQPMPLTHLPATAEQVSSALHARLPMRLEHRQRRTIDSRSTPIYHEAIRAVTGVICASKSRVTRSGEVEQLQFVGRQLCTKKRGLGLICSDASKLQILQQWRGKVSSSERRVERSL
jgi:hypothetical protein